jgi:anti-sigma regulatory factor (Ser/Thr protein kinase)
VRATVDDAALPDFRHEALLYSGQDDFLVGTGAFIREAVAAEEPILVVVSAAKIAMLKDTLGPDERKVQFADMANVGLNPARIIPAWVDFVAQHAGPGRRLRGIGEPIWSERAQDELVECQRHEALLNVAFDNAADFWLLCPYDITALDRAVVEEAHRSHPYVAGASGHAAGQPYAGDAVADTHLHTPLPNPGGRPHVLHFDEGSLAAVRRMVSRHAARAGFGPERIADAVFVVNEVAGNSITHGGGAGTLLVWSDPGALVCDVRDHGRIGHPLADRSRPGPGIDGARGLWLANQLCDLVQLRSFKEGSVVRLHMRSAR